MKKFFLTVLLATITVLSVFGLSSCDEECTHEWGEWSVSSPSTCAAQGTKQRKCSKCDEVQTESIDIADHEYDTENLVWTWNGYESATATLSCITDSTHTRQINANVTDEVTTAPTCTATGTKTYTATVKIDGITYTATKNETLAALGHTEVTDAAVAATCEKTGLTEGSHCSVCKEVLVAQQETPKAAHTETKIEAVAATCSAEGATEGVKCSACGEILVAPQPTSKVAHTEETIPAVAATCEKAGLTEGKKCSVCGEVLVAQTETALADHTEEIVPAVAATCSENGLTEGKKCSICDEVLVAQQPTDKLPHTETALLGVAPSCSEEGLTEGKKCSVCGTVTVAQEPIDKLPHTEETVVGTAPTCSTTGLSDGKKCFVCKETLVAQTILPKVACDYESVITAPTCEAQGYTTHTCSMCKESFVDTYVDELGHNWGAWEVSGSYTLRNCINECNCGKYQRISSISATYNGIRLLTGESVWKDDVVVTATLSDGTTLDITDFTLENDVMTVDGINYVTVKFNTLSTDISVPAIYDNLSGTTAAVQFEYTESGDAITITKFIGTATNVVIPNHINRVPVRAIATSAFANCVELISVTIPGNIKTIDTYCFQGCKRLETVTFNEGLQTINGAAFMGCPITSITIPNSVVTINAQQYGWSSDNLFYGAFEDCTQLKTVVIGSSLENIARETFRGCTSLTDVTIGERVETIGAYAFANCTALEYIYIPENVLTIDDHAFDGCIYLDNIDFGTGVNSVGSYAFSGCTDLTAITIPDNVITLGNNVFNNCTALQDVTIEKSKELVRSFGSNVFNGCSNLDRIYYTGTSEEWAEITINSNNVYPLSVTPYFYSENQPSAVGDYWYYNSSGLKRVWNITDIAFEAEYYSENFVDLFGDESSSYSTLFYNNITNDAEFMSDLYAWETLNIIANSSLVDGVWKVSKKDLYKVLLYDLMCGQPDAQEHIFDSLEYATLTYVAEFTKEFAGEIKSDEIFTIPASAVNCAKLAKYGIVGLEGYFERAENLHEALESCAREKAFSDMNVAFQMLLMRIANDSSAPQDLRDAARECAELYQTVTQEVYEKMISDSEDAATNKAIVATFAGVAWDWFASKAFPGLSAAQLAAKGLLLLANLGYNVDDVYMSFYKLSAAVKLEAALRNIIEDTLPDYYRISNRANAENYVYAVDMYKTSVLLGFDYSNALLRAEAEAKLPDEKLEYELMMLEISIMQDQKQELYESFDELVSEAYVAYYS